jgi:hypothetical protein
MTLSRRSLITGLASLVAAPAIVRVSSLMPVKAWADTMLYPGGVTLADLEYDEKLAVAMTRGLNGLIPWGASSFTRVGDVITYDWESASQS